MRSKEEKLEFKKNLEARTLDFSILVFKLLNALPNNSAMRVIVDAMTLEKMKERKNG